jgi:predicted ATP-dependent serine protease
MAVTTMILGHSGSGKTASLRNLNPEKTLLIQPVRKPLPFKAAGWKYYDAGSKEGNIFVVDNAEKICAAINKTSRDVVIIDDFQYILANEFMNRSHETGYVKYTEIAKNAWSILMCAAGLNSNSRIYLLSHLDSTEDGRVKAKTIGKLLDEKITLEGLVTIVLRTHVINEQYIFSTRNSGNDTVKSPMGMFESEHVENDLKLVDETIQSYYSLNV